MPTIRVGEFDTWRPGYGDAEVRVLGAGTDTLASIFTDFLCTLPADNPQTLIERLGDDGISYGRFLVPLYIQAPYELEINSVDRTGVISPSLTDLDGENADEAEVTVEGGTEAITLEDHLARRIDVRDYGDWIAVGEPGASAATNNATLTAALGVAGGIGGGYVEIPGGTYQHTNLTIGQGVIIRGAGRVATTLQSTVAGDVWTIGGERAGFSRITIDGVTKVGSSVGVRANNKDEIVFDDVEVKRFETGIYTRGGTDYNWFSLFVSNCTNGWKCHGDLASGVGASIYGNTWRGGKVELCSTVGIELKYVDTTVTDNVVSDVLFDSNTGTAVKIIGARWTKFPNCRWTGNTANMTFADATPLTEDTTVIGVECVGGFMTDGTMTIAGNAEAVIFRRMTFDGVSVTLTTPGHNILAEDCREVALTLAGITPTSWERHKTNDRGATQGLSNDAVTNVKAWAITLESGQHVLLEAKVIARGRDNSDQAYFHFIVSARRARATLNYDTQTVNYTLGDILTGGTSGATGRIVFDADAGATGALSLQDVNGTFVDNEIITDESGGHATVNGPLSEGSAVLVGTNNYLLINRSTLATTYDAAFVANGSEIELQVVGGAARLAEWYCDVDVVSV